MKVIIQRVKKASCEVDDELINEINQGLLIFVGFENGDELTDIDKLVDKISRLRIFEDEKGKINLNVSDVDGEILSISQFTLAANCRKGNRPSFDHALKPMQAKEYYDYFNQALEKYIVVVKPGIFGADMQISLINDGPFTIVLDSKEFR